MINKEAAQTLIESTIEHGITHSYYKEAIEIAKEAQELNSRYKADQAEAIKRTRIRETEEQKEQRLELTETITSVALAPVYTYWEDVWRVDGIGKDIRSDSETIKDRVQQKMSEYYDGESLHRYAFKTALHYNKYDPNAWILFERETITGPQGEGADVNFYPIVWPCATVLNFHKGKNGVEWVIFKEVIKKQITVNKRVQEVDVSDFWIYGPGFFWHYAEMPDDVWSAMSEDERDMFADYERAFLSVGGDDIIFLIKYQENGFTEVPALPLGAYGSGRFNNVINVTPVDDAIPLLRDLQRDKSYLDVGVSLNVFTRLFMTVKRCKFKDAAHHECKGGVLQGITQDEYESGKYRDNTCPNCKGDGWIKQDTEQGFVGVPFPEAGQEMLDLSKLIHKEKGDIEVVTMLMDKLDKASKRVMAVILNQEQYDSTSSVKTAMEVGLNHTRLYNKLSPFAEKVGRIWSLQHRLAFQAFNDPNGTGKMTYPADFAMKTVEQLQKEYRDAVESGQGYEVIWQIKCQILQKIHRNSPEMVDEIKAFERFRPFRDKPEQVQLSIVQGRAKNDPQRVLFENWPEIQEAVRIKLGTEKFHRQSYDRQKALIGDAVAMMIEKILYPEEIDFTSDIISALD
jgi:hypothetical protein